MNELNIPGNQAIPNQAKLIIQAFSLQLVKTTFSNVPQPAAKQSEIGRDKEVSISKLGTPVFSNLSVQGSSYTKNGQTFNFDNLQIDTVLFQVTNKKNIVSTAVQGRDGTIKEYISDGDADINIKGVLTAPNNTFPLDEFRALIKTMKAPVPLKVNSWYLNELGIYNIVVTEFDLIQEPGKYSQQAFNIMALSDTPIELNISK